MTNHNTAYRNRTNNARGKAFEDAVCAACEYYKGNGAARIEKIPEPFRVAQGGKQGGGIFTGRFTAAAEPDFQGTLVGGRSIVFETKYTSTDRLNRNVLTDAQMKALSEHYDLGAVAGICGGICDTYFFMPWTAWRDMKELFGRLYVTAQDVCGAGYRVRFTGAVMFLDGVRKWGNDFDCEGGGGA